MKYVSISEARKLPGLRLVLTPHIPAASDQAAKAILKLRGVDYIPVEQRLNEDSEEFREWTGVRITPVAVFDEEPPMTTWLDILLLAERLGKGPSLLPNDFLQRALVLGLCTEICGRDGLAWSTRLLMQDPDAHAKTPTPVDTPKELLQDYGVRPDAVAKARDRIHSILRGLAAQLHKQKARGSSYFVGDQLSACDVYWTFLSIPVASLSRDELALPDWLRARHAQFQSKISEAIDPVLIEHRNMILHRHIGLPLDF